MTNIDFSELKTYMNRLTSWRIPGNSITIYIDNRRVFDYSSGYSDVENKMPMTGNELLNIYSCSKVATVTAALQLYEKGIFLLDDPLCEYIPEFRDMYVKDKDGNIVKAKNPITLRHLFTMTAGLTYNMNTNGINAARSITNGKMDTVQVAKCIARDPLAFEPGEKWNYSLCHDVLAAVVEMISGERFETYVKKHIFEPIGIKNVFYHRNDAVKSAMAQQYNYETGDSRDIVERQIETGNMTGKWVNVGKEAEHVLGESYDSGGAGIVVSVPDYALFGSTLANGGFAPNGEKILSAGTIELMRTNQLNEKQMKYFNWSQLKGYGYGLGVRTLINKAESGTTGNVGEFGWGGAAGATLLVDPDCKLAYFYSHHMLNPQENYYQPRLRNVVYGCL